MRRVALLAGLAAALALPSAGGAAIVIGKSIGGVALGMGQKKVQAVLGKPARVERGSNDFGPYTVFHYRQYVVRFQGEIAVTHISTTSPRERTKRGIGVGSTRAQVLARVPGVRCEGDLCHVNEFEAGARVTAFLLKKGRVTGVDVGIVID